MEILRKESWQKIQHIRMALNKQQVFFRNRHFHQVDRILLKMERVELFYLQNHQFILSFFLFENQLL